MSKKKKQPAQSEPLPEISPEELARGKEILSALKADISYNNAKKHLVQAMPCSRSIANAIVVKLYEEGFEFDEHSRNWFTHPEAKTAVGIVQGARRVGEFKVEVQDDKEGGPCTLSPHSFVVPGDVAEMRRTTTGWRASRLINRAQKRWVCTFQGSNGESLCFKPISPFAPMTLMVPTTEVPQSVDLKKEAVELELDVAAPFNLKIRDYAVDWYDDDDGSGAHPFDAHFVRVVGVRNDPLGEMAIASASFGVPIDFAPETLEEAQKLPDKVDRRSLTRRVDLTDLPFVTIDGEDARDFDDAVYCVELPEGGWRLLVAIADVSHYVRPKSSLDRDAQKRATSVYFPASVVPMLPEKLSNGLCSLNPGVDRLTMVCDAVVNFEGVTTAYQFYPAVIHSHARLTYNVVWSALNDEPDGLAAVGERIAEIKRLESLFKALRAARVKRGALDFETQESAAVFNEKGAITGFRVREHNDAHRIIEECMLVANVCAAQFVIAKKQLTLFRVHDKPEESRLRDLRALLSSFGIPFKVNDETPLVKALCQAIEASKDRPYIQTAILRTMQRACYQPENIGHFGLQYSAYAHFTSPIRRYPDLLLHRTIKGILSRRTYVPEVVFDDSELMTGYHARKLGARPEEGPKEGDKPLSRSQVRLAAWNRLGLICSAAERRADDASRDVMKFLKCSFLEKEMGEIFDGVVTGLCPAGIFVELEAMPIEGFVHISELGWGYYEYVASAQKMISYEEMTEVRLGDRVRVRVDIVDVNERRINFNFVSNYESHVIRGRGVRHRKNQSPRFFGFNDDFDD